MSQIWSIIISQFWRMSISINERRDQMRQDIRKREREEFFLKERMKIMVNYRHNSPISIFIANLKNKNNLPQTFQEINKIINGASFLADVNKMIEQGLIPLLMSFLRGGLSLKETLEAISFLVEKMKPQRHCIDIFERMYCAGILEYLLSTIKHKELSAFSAYIIFAFSEAKEDYSEALAFGNGYKTLIEQFIERANQSQDPQFQNQNDGCKFYSYIICTLQNIIMMKDSALDLEANKLEIFSFVIGLIEKRIFLKPAFGIVYECLKVLGPNLGESYTGLINTIAREAPPNANYLNNLLITVYLMSPNSTIDYTACFQAAIKSHKLYKLILFVLEKMLKSKDVSAMIPYDEVFWQKLLINPQDDQTFKRLLHIAAQLPLNKDLMWRVLTASLDCQGSIGVQIESLAILYQRIMAQERQTNLIDRLYKHRVHQHLLKLTHSKNNLISQKSSYLLDYITGPLVQMSNRLE